MYVVTIECLYHVGMMDGWVERIQAESWEEVLKIASHFSASVFKVTFKLIK